MAGLKIFHVNKIYDNGAHAVKDFCLDVNDKEFVVFVGPSGCGKSTTLRMIAGLEKITSGDMYIGNRLVNGLTAKERNISMVFQSYALFPNMSVYDNISFGLRMHGEDKEVIRQKVEEVAEMLNLTEYLKRKPSQLSGGQKQRVALGRAIVRNPDLFLLDEPLSNLDAKLRTKMRNQLLALHRKLGATFIYVTHDQTEAMTMGDKIVVMRDGEVMQVGSPDLLYRYPSNKFVASFIGTPQMNFWKGQMDLSDGIKVKTALGDISLTGETALRLDSSALVQGKQITVGLRPEDFSAQRLCDTDVQVTFYADVVEELCTHSVLHGTLGEEDIVAYGDSGREVGEVTLFANASKIHLFDENEQSLLPQYAPKTTVKGVKNGNLLHVLGCDVVLSEEQAALEDGNVQVAVFADAFCEGTAPVSCEKTFSTPNGNVSLVEIDEQKLYALGNFAQTKTFGLDASRLDIIGSQTVSAINEVSKINFIFEKRRCSEGGKTIDKHFCVLNKDVEVESFYEFNKKMYRLGKSIFNTRYSMYVSVDNVRLAHRNEPYPTIQGVVQSVADYGTKQYSSVKLSDSSSLLVEDKLPVGEVVTLALDLDNVRVGVVDTEIILF